MDETEIRAYDNKKIEDLEKQIAELKESNRQTSDLLFEFTRRTLLSSASIQTAVSSLLSENFLWDGSSNREFLEIIDDSINFICNQLSLVSMLLRIQSDKIEIRFEKYPIEEILSGTVDTIKKKLKKDSLIFQLSESISLINADYNYINTGLSLFFSAISDLSSKLVVTGRENPKFYELKIDSCPLSVYKAIQTLASKGSLPSDITRDKGSNSSLKLLVSTKLLALQNIIITPFTNGEDSYSILISMPICSSSMNNQSSP